MNERLSASFCVSNLATESERLDIVALMKRDIEAKADETIGSRRVIDRRWLEHRDQDERFTTYTLLVTVQ